VDVIKLCKLAGDFLSKAMRERVGDLLENICGSGNGWKS
jgi:hypothetical protein